jgi:hypothetical protein
LKHLLFLSILATAVLNAGSLTGTWSGTFDIKTPDGQVRSETMCLTLKEENAKVTGTAGPNADRQVEIINGKVSGDRITFQVSDPSSPAAISFELTLASDRLYGDARAEHNGQKMEGKIALKRP